MSKNLNKKELEQAELIAKTFSTRVIKEALKLSSPKEEKEEDEGRVLKPYRKEEKLLWKEKKRRLKKK